MSVAEIKAELTKLSAPELAEIEAALLQAKQSTAAAVSNTASYMGCMSGTAELKPGWDEDEPLEMWKALRDDPSS